MIFLKAIILLLVTNVLVQCNIKNQKVEETLKNVGKRLSNFGLKQYFRSFYKDFMVPDNWDTNTENEVNAFKKHIMKIVGDDIYQQYSLEDTARYNHELNFLSVLDDEVVVELCDTGVKMNKYQFAKYFRRDRVQYLRKESDDELYHKLYNNHDPQKLVFMQMMNLKSHWKFEVQTVWKVTAKLKVTGLGRVFRITHIIIGGACFDYGSIIHDYTEVGTEGHGFTATLKDTNPDIQTLKNTFTDDADYADEVPIKWLDGLADKDLSIIVCTHKMIIPKLSKEEFLAWYDKFGIMWHPVRNGTEDFLRVQVIKATPGDKLIARLTMKLQCGSNVNSTDIFDWDFKVITKYNEHGDGKWYIKTLEVMCPLNYDPLTLHQRHIPDVVYLRDFTKHGRLETYSCELGTTSNLTQLQLRLYYDNQLRNATIYEYKVDYDDIPVPAKVDSYFRMSTKTFMKKDTNKTVVFVHDWKFVLKWDETVHFYHISKLEIGCPKVFKSPEDVAGNWRFGRSEKE
ncbi:unnamed protein product [Caenorhabditis brenneri]